MNFLSKKIFAIVLFSMLISANVFSQHSEREYKKYFDENREIFISYDKASEIIIDLDKIQV